jgi:hypothetical protein
LSIARLAAVMDNKRKTARKSLGRPCWIRPGHDQVHAAVLVDVSQAGAKVTLPRPLTLPDSFDLLLTRDGRVGRKSEVAWKTETEVGLRFVSRQVPPLSEAECEPEDIALEVVKV